MNVDGKKSDMRETTVKTVPTAKPGSCFQLEEVGSVWVKPWWLHNVLNGDSSGVTHPKEWSSI